MNLNKVQIIGRLTRDPELKSLPSGAPVCNFSMATSRVWFDQQKQKQEETEFHNCIAWNKTGENIAQYVKKGHLLYIEGRLQTRSWDDKTTGEKKYRTDIVVETCQFAPKSMSPQGSSDDGSAEDLSSVDFGDTPSSKPSAKKPVQSKGYDGDLAGAIDYGESTINIDDIPF